MARTHFYEAIIDEEGNFLENIEVSVYDADTEALATIYTGRTGGGLKANPFETAATEAEFFVDPGIYRIDFHDTELPIRKADYSVYYDAVSGEAEGITFGQLPTGTEGMSYTILSTGIPGLEYKFADTSTQGAVLIKDSGGYMVTSNFLVAVATEPEPLFFDNEDSFINYALDGDTRGAQFFYWDASQWARSNRTTRWRIQASVLNNAVTPTASSNVIAGIHGITDSEDTAGQVALDKNADATIETSSMLLGNGTQTVAAATANAPATPGPYAPTLWRTTSQAVANHAIMVSLQLYVYWVVP